MQALTIITAYLITSDDRAPRTRKQTACHFADLLVSQMTISGIICVCICILYLRCKEAMLTIPYKGLATTTTIAGKWLIVKYYMTITNDS